jgi:hypothetical protein
VARYASGRNYPVLPRKLRLRKEIIFFYIHWNFNSPAYL